MSERDRFEDEEEEGSDSCSEEIVDEEDDEQTIREEEEDEEMGAEENEQELNALQQVAILRHMCRVCAIGLSSAFKKVSCPTPRLVSRYAAFLSRPGLSRCLAHKPPSPRLCAK